jgi:hypothetical protein
MAQAAPPAWKLDAVKWKSPGADGDPELSTRILREAVVWDILNGT